MAKSRRSWLLPNSHPRDGQQLRTREWEHDGATYGGDEPPGEAYGQVEDFEYDDRGDFQADDLRVPHRVHCVAADHHIYAPPMIIRVGNSAGGLVCRVQATNVGSV